MVSNVHQALHASHYAPKLIGWSKKPEVGVDAFVMEYLLKPTNVTSEWMTLHNLAPALVFEKKDLIYDELKTIVALLEGRGVRPWGSPPCQYHGPCDRRFQSYLEPHSNKRRQYGMGRSGRGSVLSR